MGTVTLTEVAQQLSAGLDLCVRARRMDAQDRANNIAEHFPGVDLERFAARQNADDDVYQVASRSGTIALWVQDQYERDLAAWEHETRAMLMRLPEFQPPGGDEGV